MTARRSDGSGVDDRPVKAGRVVACVGCRGRVPDVEGPTHAYMQASPGCWQLYGELGATAMAAQVVPEAAWYHVDCYAVQHPGGRHAVAERALQPLRGGDAVLVAGRSAVWGGAGRRWRLHRPIRGGRSARRLDGAARSGGADGDPATGPGGGACAC